MICDGAKVSPPILPSVKASPPGAGARIMPPIPPQVKASPPPAPGAVSGVPILPGVRVGFGGPAGAGVVELYDRVVAPVPAPTFLLFDRDLDGDVQQIILGTVD